MKKCKLLSPWSTTDEVVAEDRWQCKEPTSLVDCLPLGPNAVKVFVDVVHEPETFLWRPRPEVTYLRDSVKNFVAWPANKCVFESNTDSQCCTSPTANAVKSVSQSATKKSPTTASCAAPSPGSKSPINPLSPKVKNTQAASPVRKSQVKFVVYGLNFRLLVVISFTDINCLSYKHCSVFVKMMPKRIRSAS